MKKSGVNKTTDEQTKETQRKQERKELFMLKEVD